jgi:hypothetical protein
MKTVSARMRSGADRGIGLKIVPFGPRADQMRTLGERVAKHRAVKALLGKTRHRLLRIDLIDLNTEAKPAAPRPPDGFRAVFYDYTTERTVFATGTFARLQFKVTDRRCSHCRVKRNSTKLRVWSPGMPILPQPSAINGSSLINRCRRSSARVARTVG